MGLKVYKWRGLGLKVYEWRALWKTKRTLDIHALSRPNWPYVISNSWSRSQKQTKFNLPRALSTLDRLRINCHVMFLIKYIYTSLPVGLKSFERIAHGEKSIKKIYSILYRITYVIFYRGYDLKMNIFRKHKEGLVDMEIPCLKCNGFQLSFPTFWEVKDHRIKSLPPLETVSQTVGFRG